MHRRDFLSSGSVLCTGMPLLASLEASNGSVNLLENLWQQIPPPVQPEGSSFAFWTKEVRDPKKGEIGAASLNSRGAMFFYYDDHSKKFVGGTDIDPDSLPEKGDTNIELRVLRFRPSQGDRSSFEHTKGGSLRIDVQQQEPLAGLLEKLAWTSISGLVPGEKGKLPDLSSLKFDPGSSWGQLQQIPLPGGEGRWTWNFFLQREQSVWGKILKVVHSGVTAGAPQAFFGVLGLPAIGLSALEQVDKLVAYLTNIRDQEWLFKSPAFYVGTTKKACKHIGTGVLPLKTGNYLIVPEGQAQQMDTSWTINSAGLLVPLNTSAPKQFQVAAQTAPGLTYLTVYVNAQLKSS